MARKPEINPDQEVMFEHTAFGRENAVSHDEASAVEQQAGAPTPEQFPAVDVAERNRALVGALGHLGTAMEYKPYLGIDSNPSLKRRFQKEHGKNYQHALREAINNHNQASADFRDSFAELWGYDAILERRNARVSDEEQQAENALVLRAQMKPDRDEFERKFANMHTNNSDMTKKAARNREKYRTKMDEQKQAYVDRGLG